MDHFDKKLGRDVTAPDLLGLRTTPRNGYNGTYYLARNPVDQWLADCLQKYQPVILTGKPLSGKSRAMLHLPLNKQTHIASSVFA